jgi:S1-C subfamily serine protease
MSDQQEWAFPESMQPKAAETQFDLLRALDAMVLVRAQVPEDAFTAATLGTERGGYGVVIREDGLVLTIGYLITEATQVWLTSNRGVVVAGYPLAYDQASGFGLVLPLGKLGAPHLNRGLAADLKVGDSAFVLGHGGLEHALRTRLVSKHEFAGYWEYLLDEALFAAPAHPQWGGAALVDAQGDLVGLGSLLVQREADGETEQVNMFVPVDLLHPILDAMLKTGRGPQPPNPWLGMYTQEHNAQLRVGALAPGGPAAQAGLRVGDTVLAVGEERVHELAPFYRAVWRLGPPGTGVPLTLARRGAEIRATIRSADRNDFLAKPSLQ